MEKDFFDASRATLGKIHSSEHARLNSIDYKHNGARARANTGEFIAPLWVLDETIDKCTRCSSNFNWVNRRHHCRHCGKIFCEECSASRCLLPEPFGERDPQRVCVDCHNVLVVHQRTLTKIIANHQRVNSVDVASESCSIRRYTNLPFSSTLGSEIRKAAYSIHNLFQENWIHDEMIPIRLMATARGLAFLTVVKGGFILAPRLGTGLVIARLPDGRWSGPCAIGTVGVSWGALAGADLTDHVIILNTDDAVHAFSGLGQVTIGAGIDVAVGPLGRSGSAELGVGDGGAAAAFSYSHSRGLFAGLALEGSVILARPDLNHRFYGRAVTPAEILGLEFDRTGGGAGGGRGGGGGPGVLVPPPRAALPLYDAIAAAIACVPNSLHKHNRPSPLDGGLPHSHPPESSDGTSRAGCVGQSQLQPRLSGAAYF